MAIELRLSRSENETPWGFRITGGVECDVPITVTKVTEDSVAFNSGLVEEDVIVRINETATAGLTHGEVHDLLIAGGNCLILAVRRGDFEVPHAEKNAEEEVSEILETGNEVVTQEQTIQPPVSEEDLTRLSPLLVAERAEIIDPAIETKPQEQNKPKGNKWSTFLQKPKHPKPILKKSESEIKAAPYRVIIKKQKKKGSKEEKIEEPTIEPPEQNDEPEKEDCPADLATDTSFTEHEETYEQQTEIEDLISEVEEKSKSPEPDPEPEPEPELISNRSNRRSLEEKLADVQRQLQALAQLPSTIQTTLDAVTKELANIVRAKDNLTTEAEDSLSEDNCEVELTEDNIGFDEEAVEEEEETNREPGSEEEEEHYESQEVQPAIPEEDEEIDSLIEPEPELDPEAGLTEEEKAERRAEQERQDKQEKEREEFRQQRLSQRPTQVLRPIERPIILPGGRKWSQPDDVQPAIKNPKMSDDKICNTIETYSEVISGKTKG